MKKQGILNSEIASVLATLGHTDKIVIADCGLPIPDHVPRIDLALKLGTPSFMGVLDTILADMEVEKMTWASELKEHNYTLHQTIQQQFELSSTFVSHEELKEITKEAKVVIRTGEATPFSNVVLTSGVIF